VHTHWDREWYQPFETFRTYLVSVLRQVLDDLESNRLPCFYLDGQAVVLEDALAIAPELAPRVKTLMDVGKLAAGPWYVAPDQMLVCGESLVRNLKTGIACVRSYGEPAFLGYAPDTFGHSQDLPRLLCGFGINSAFVWRGVPALRFGPCFWWQSPDGSQVLAYHLSRGYYQTSLLEKAQAGLSSELLDEYTEELNQFATDRSQWDNPGIYGITPEALIYPIGGDHTAPPHRLAEIMHELKPRLKSKGLELTLVQLSDFAALLQKQARAAFTLTGLIESELRDNSTSRQHNNAYLLPGVLSTRLYLKRENREAERRLFRFCEPLFSILTVRGLASYPQAELWHALRLLLKNQAHDSISGCCLDAVHTEMLVRFARVHQIINPLLEDAKWRLSGLPEDSPRAADDPQAGLTRLRVVNPGGRDFSGVVPLQWYEAPQQTADNEYDARANLQIMESELTEQLFGGWGRVPYYAAVERKRGFIWVENVPTFGELNLDWTQVANGNSKVPPARLRGKTLDNGILKVQVDKQRRVCVIWTEPGGKKRRFVLNHVLRDTADGGDTYNYDPLPGDRPITARLVSVEPGKRGPLLASLLLKYELRIPESLLEEKPAGSAGSKPLLPSFKRSDKKLLHEIETEIILKKSNRIVEFETRFLNQASGHRLEVLLSTGNPVTCSFSENHFSLVRRYHQNTPRGRTTLPVDTGCEAPCDRFPAQRFLIANGQLILNRGLPEYGAVREAVSLTLLRSVSMLSRGRMQTRGGGAGPHLSVSGAECKGLNQASYAWSPLSIFEKGKILAGVLETEIISEAYDLAETYEQEIFCAFSSHEHTATPSLFRCDNAAVRLLGAYVSADFDELYVRMQNVSNEELSTKVMIKFDFQSVHLCRLDEEAGEEAFLYREYVEAGTSSDSEPAVCTLEIKFGANELKTMKLRLKAGATENAPAAARSRKRRSSGSSKTG
jgi:mannosylglycerate hydrolase